MKKRALYIWDAIKPTLQILAISFLIGYAGFTGLMAAAKTHGVTMAIAMESEK